MNTTINYAYKFLRQKLHIVSQFLFDEHIRSQLARDIKYFGDNFDAVNGMYPVARAEKFHSGIRKLGVSAEGLTHLDQLRMVVTHVGNCLGYVRLIGTGAHAVQSATLDCIVEPVVTLRPMVDQCVDGDAVGQSAALLDTLTELALASQHDGRQQAFFTLLVDVFAVELRDVRRHAHLAQFYMILPPLIVNFIEYSLKCKERLMKRQSTLAANKHAVMTNVDQTMAFSDDGFSMGVAYLLHLFDQNVQFESLHWFASIYTKIASEMACVFVVVTLFRLRHRSNHSPRSLPRRATVWVVSATRTRCA